MATGTTAQQTVDVVTPAAGESVTEGTILEWHVKVGDFIKADDTIVEISTDKVDLELPSPASGMVSDILIAEGETVTVGQVIARIAVGASSPAAEGTNGGHSPSEPAPAPAPSAPAPASESDTVTDTTVEQTIDVVTPAAGDSVSEGTILEWHVKVGDFIKADETIVEISTDKVDLELPSPASGTVSEILIAEGETVTVGQVIARIAVGASSPVAEGTNGGHSPSEPAPAPAPSAPAPATESDTVTDTTVEQTIDVVTPAAGESVSEGTILEWHVKVGDFIKADETIVEISTDKVDLELPSPASGTVSEILIAEGETVTVGQVIARIALGASSPATGAN